jgi:hypothetical protein
MSQTLLPSCLPVAAMPFSSTSITWAVVSRSLRIVNAPREDGGTQQLVDRTEHAVRHHPIRNVPPEDSLLLPAPLHLAHHLDVLHWRMMRKPGEELCALSHLGLHQDRHTAVHRAALQMHLRNILELLAWPAQHFERLFHLLMKFVEGRIDGDPQDLILALEIEIDRAVGTQARFAIALTVERKYPCSAIASTAACRMRRYFSPPGPLPESSLPASASTIAGAVLLALFLSPGLKKPEVSSADPLMNPASFAENELWFYSKACGYLCSEKE